MTALWATGWWTVKTKGRSLGDICQPRSGGGVPLLRAITPEVIALGGHQPPERRIREPKRNAYQARLPDSHRWLRQYVQTVGNNMKLTSQLVKMQ